MKSSPAYPAIPARGTLYLIKGDITNANVGIDLGRKLAAACLSVDQRHTVEGGSAAHMWAYKQVEDAMRRCYPAIALSSDLMPPVYRNKYLALGALHRYTVQCITCESTTPAPSL